MCRNAICHTIGERDGYNGVDRWDGVGCVLTRWPCGLGVSVHCVAWTGLCGVWWACRPPDTTAPLARHLAAVLRELDDLPSPETESTLVDELRRRHDMRIASLDSSTSKGAS
jgi:hypothetical protein